MVEGSKQDMIEFQKSQDIEEFRNYLKAIEVTTDNVEKLTQAQKNFLDPVRTGLERMRQEQIERAKKITQLQQEKNILGNVTIEAQKRIKLISDEMVDTERQIETRERMIATIEAFVAKKKEENEVEEENGKTKRGITAEIERLKQGYSGAYQMIQRYARILGVSEEQALKQILANRKMLDSIVNDTKLSFQGLEYEQEQSLSAREKFLQNFHKKVKEMDRKTLKHFAKMKGEEGQIAQDELEKRKEKRQEYAKFGINQAQDLASSIFSFQRAELENRQQIEIEKAKARGASAEEIEQINQKYAKERKKQAVKEALINSALAITKVFATTEFPFNLIAATIIGAKTALEVATIKAQEFFKGTKDSPEGLAWVGEKGTEKIITPDGQEFLTPDKPTLTYLPAHTEVVPNDVLQKDLAEMQAGRKRLPAQEDGTKKIVDAINRKELIGLNITEGGISVTSKKGNSFFKYVDRKYRK